LKIKIVSGIMLMLLFIGMLTLAFKIQPAKAEPDGIGEWISDGRIELCVHSFDTSPSIDYYPYTPASGCIFAWVDLSIKNVDTEEVGINQLYAYLKDTDNYVYARFSTLSPKRLALVDLPPEETIRGEIYFEVPTEAVIAEFLWNDFKSNISVVIPEFPSFLILPLFMIVTLLVVIVYKTKHSM